MLKLKPGSLYRVKIKFYIHGFYVEPGDFVLYLGILNENQATWMFEEKIGYNEYRNTRIPLAACYFGFVEEA